MRKILHIYKSSSYDSFGGVENFLNTLIFGLNKSNNHFKHYILTFSKKTNKVKIVKKNKIIFILIPYYFEVLSLPISIRYIIIFLKLFNKFDILHYHLPFPYANLFTIFNNKKNLVTYHSNIVRQKKTKNLLKIFGNLIYTKSCAIIFSSRNYLKIAEIKNINKYFDKINIIRFGIPETINKSINNKSYSLPEKYFFSIGALREYKGFELLIKAFNNNNYKLILCISGHNEIKLDNFIKKYSSKNIIIKKNVNDSFKNYLYKNCFCYVLSSINASEAFGYVLLESMQFKKPLITFNIESGITEINLDNYNGYVCKEISAECLNENLKKMYNNEHLAKKFGVNSYNRLKKKFSFDVMIDKYSNIYQKL